MSTRTELRDQVSTAITDAQAIIAAVADGEYSSAAAYEADVNDWRTRIAPLIVELEAEWGNDALHTVQALRALGARLLDLRGRIAEGVTIMVTEVDRPCSLMELAMEWYADPTRWREIRLLNPRIRHPGFVTPGTRVQRHAR